jgi:hypothetical protein
LLKDTKLILTAQEMNLSSSSLEISRKLFPMTMSLAE